MKRLLTITLLISLCITAFSQNAIDTNYSADVQSVYLTPEGNELGMPCIRIAPLNSMADDSQPRLLLRFDILSPQPEHFQYRIRHCSARWELDGLDAGEFFSGTPEGNITEHQSSFTTLKDYTNYYQTIPDPYNYFLLSGNYLLEVFPSDNPDSVILSRRFYVYEDMVDINASVTKPSGAYGNIYRDQEVDVEISPRKGSYLALQSDYYHVKVQQNRRQDLCRSLSFSGYSGESMRYFWQKPNVFPGGNHFRYFDLSNLWAAMYHVQKIDQFGDETFAFLQPEEDRSNKAYTQYNSLNGGMKTNIRERRDPNIEADYVWVNFSLPMERPYLGGSIHIVGDLTQWNMGDISRMEWNAKYKAYTKRLLLKQGYYSYQILYLPAGEKEAITATFEGDHYAMTNNYTIYVYYISPGSRYDRLIGIKTIAVP